MQKSTRQRQRTSGGNVILESALIFTIFFCMLIGTFDFGQFLFIHQSLVERTRYATRWGAINDATTDQITNMILYNQSSNPGSGTTGYFNLTSSMITVTKTTDSVCFTSGAQSNLFKRVTVNLHDYPYVILSPYIAGSYTGPNITVDAPIFQDFSSLTTTCP